MHYFIHCFFRRATSGHETNQCSKDGVWAHKAAGERLREVISIVSVTLHHSQNPLCCSV